MSISLNAFASPIVTNLIEPVNYFTGRHEYLSQIDNHFDNNKKIITITGIAGIGKSQIARRYAFKNQNNYKILWFFDCKRALEPQFQELAKQINLKLCRNNICKITDTLSEVTNAVISYLINNNGWLLVFDNFLDSTELNIIEVLGSKIKYKDQHILITARHKGVLPNVISIKPFKREESIELLRHILASYSGENLNMVASLLKDYPLGLTKSAFFLLQNPYISVNDYKIMINKDFDVLDKINEIDIYSAEQSILKLVKSYLNKLQPESRKVLIYCSLLDNSNLYKNLLYDIYAKSSNDSEYNNFLNILLELNNYSLIEYKKRKNMSNETNDNSQIDLELHDLIQKSIHQSVDKSVLNDHLTQLIKKANLILSNNVLEQILSKYPLLISNLEALINNAQLYSIDAGDLLQLKKNLLVLYLYELDYLKVKSLINWFDEKLKNKNVIPDTPLMKSTIADYLAARGWYYDNINDEYEVAIEDYKKALNLIAPYEKNYYELICDIYIVLAQTEINAGDLSNAEEHITYAEKLINKYDKISLHKKGFYYFVKSLIEMNKGSNEKALEIINKGVEIKKSLAYGFQASATTFLLKAEILIKLDKVKEAYFIVKELYEKSKTHFEGVHEMQSRILTELAIAELELGQLDLSEKHINQAIKVLFSHNSTLVTPSDNDNILSKNDDLAYMYVVKGDLEFKKKKFNNAFNHYKAALKIFQLRYKVYQVDHISELYYKLAISALELKDIFTFNQFLTKHENDFGITHLRTKKFYEYATSKK